MGRALVHSSQPDKFPDSEVFEEEYSTQTMDGVSSLHAVLRCVDKNKP
jgi:hypothetical protein